MMFDGKRLLFIAPHMDDVELGCGGTIASLRDRSEVHVLALSQDRKDSEGRVQERRNVEEQYQALAELGVKREHLIVSEGISGQIFPEQRQRLLEELYAVGKKIQPDLIFTPTIHDAHQDHRTTYQAAQKAFKRVSHLAYEVINSAVHFAPNCYVELNERAIAAKVNAVACFQSQANPEITTGDYFSEEVIRALARTRGVRMGMEYAEAFEIVSLLA